MCRGQGSFHCKNMDDRTTQGIFICKNHQAELGGNWKSSNYEHLKKASGKYRCCISSDIFPELSCTGSTNLTTLFKLNKSMAEQLLLNKGVLYHLGISKFFCNIINSFLKKNLDLCRNHYDSINNLPFLTPAEALQRIQVNFQKNCCILKYNFSKIKQKICSKI